MVTATWYEWARFAFALIGFFCCLYITWMHAGDLVSVRKHKVNGAKRIISTRSLRWSAFVLLLLSCFLYTSIEALFRPLSPSAPWRVVFITAIQPVIITIGAIFSIIDRKKLQHYLEAINEDYQ